MMILLTAHPVPFPDFVEGDSYQPAWISRMRYKNLEGGGPVVQRITKNPKNPKNPKNTQNEQLHTTRPRNTNDR